MQSSDVRSGIQRSWEIIRELDLGETYSNPLPLVVEAQFRDAILSADARYIDVYLLGLNLSYYNFLLTDFSYFQFSWDKVDHVRYAYYPNPFLGPTDASIEEFRRRRGLVESGDITHEEYLALLRDRPAQFRVPALRYENSPEQRRELEHPCSHFHIGYHGEDRWALNRVLSPLAFTLLIVKHYYGLAWQVYGDEPDGPYQNKLEARLAREKADKCVPVVDALFSKLEEKSFFFG